MQSDSPSATTKPETPKKAAALSTEKHETKEEKSETPKKAAKEEEKTIVSLSQESHKAKLDEAPEAHKVKIDEAAETSESEKKTTKDATDTQDLIDSVKKSA